MSRQSKEKKRKQKGKDLAEWRGDFFSFGGNKGFWHMASIHGKNILSLKNTREVCVTNFNSDEENLPENKQMCCLQCNKCLLTWIVKSLAVTDQSSLKINLGPEVLINRMSNKGSNDSLISHAENCLILHISLSQIISAEKTRFWHPL